MALNERANIFARSCIECGTPPSCPKCADTETCTLSIRTCDACPKTSCVPSTLAGAVTQQNKPAGGSAKNTGAIAGGAVAAVAAILLLTFLVWRFFIRDKKRAQVLDEDEYRASALINRAEKDANGSFAMRRDNRASASTTRSAATNMTRGSNVSNFIQIAYIPGVTAPGMSPGSEQFYPPVPPLPGASPNQIMFMPGDMRDSSLSGVSMHESGFRSSVATTIYGANAVIAPVASQTITRANAAVVSVGPAKSESSQANSVRSSQASNEKHASTDTRIQSNLLELPIMPPFSPLTATSSDMPPPSPAFSVGSTFLSNAQSAVAVSARPVVVTQAKSKAARPNTTSPLSPNTPQSPPTAIPISAVDGTSSLIDNFPSPLMGNGRDSGVTQIEDEADRSSKYSARHASRMTNSSMHSIPLFAVIEEGTPRIPSLPPALRDQTRTDSPFDDKHEVKE